MDEEVDVQLFITCRLCLNEPGSYQILPAIKDQINYCFGIDVDPFDGLPQLICKKCKSIVNEYYDTKNTFEKKQKQLKLSRLKNNAVPFLISTKASSEEPVAEVLAPRRYSERSTNAVPNDNTVEAPTANAHSRDSRSSWKKYYIEHFECSICNKNYKTKKSVKKHMTTHKNIMRKYGKIFRNYLTVQLNKTDVKKNTTGSLQNVVYNENKIIKKRSSGEYYSFYLKKGYKYDNGTDENENVATKRRLERESDDNRVLSDSSKDEIKGKKKKYRRLLSVSSTQTVVLEENKEKCNTTNNIADEVSQDTSQETGVVNTDYINLDDTSSDCPPKQTSEPEKTRILPPRQQAKANVGDYKAIQSIVTMCQKNYIRRRAQSEINNTSAFSESSLKHKVLSLGRKVINKQGFSCTGLLRYMEHKDLDITWMPTSNAMQNEACNFVRIMPKLKSREDSENVDVKWKNMHDISYCRMSILKGNSRDRIKNENEKIASDTKTLLEPVQAEEDPLLGSNHETNDTNYENVLLNTAPVANPKQLPKLKPIIINTVKHNSSMLPPISVTCELENVQDEDDNGENMCLPIITSTTSLSAVNENENQEAPVAKPAPRIKVKPASELMSERALSNQEAAEDHWGFNVMHSSLPHQLGNTTVFTAAPLVQPQSDYVSSHGSGALVPVPYQTDTSSPTNETSHREDRNQAYVILNSPELPNTKTKSPFNYFKTVLLVHGLKLLDLNDDSHQRFNCLVRFKLMLKQDTKKPIGVLLSLFCSDRNFCFTFKDTNFKTFDPNQLPAFWQWELLKIYKGDVVDKILQNAIKIGKEVHELTKHFLCLLKSIDLIKESEL